MIDGELLVERAARTLRDGGCDQVFIVLGAASDVVARADLDHAHLVVSQEWEQGQSASLEAGLAAVAATDADAVIVALVDQPWIGADAVRRLREAGTAGASAAVATYDGQPRNPVLLGRAVWGEVVSSAVGDIGARSWLRANADRVVMVACDDTGDPRDVDLAGDLPDAE